MIEILPENEELNEFYKRQQHEKNKSIARYLKRRKQKQIKTLTAAAIAAIYLMVALFTKDLVFVILLLPVYIALVVAVSEVIDHD